MSARKPITNRAEKHRARDGLAYRIQISRTPAGSPVLEFIYLGDRRTFNYRKMNIAIYLLAADLEQASEAVGADWVISPQTYDSRITIEVADHGDEQDAWRFAKEIVAGLNQG